MKFTVYDERGYEVGEFEAVCIPDGKVQFPAGPEVDLWDNGMVVVRVLVALDRDVFYGDSSGEIAGRVAAVSVREAVCQYNQTHELG